MGDRDDQFSAQADVTKETVENTKKYYQTNYEQLKVIDLKSTSDKRAKGAEELERATRTNFERLRELGVMTDGRAFVDEVVDKHSKHLHSQCQSLLTSQKAIADPVFKAFYESKIIGSDRRILPDSLRTTSTETLADLSRDSKIAVSKLDGIIASQEFAQLVKTRDELAKAVSSPVPAYVRTQANAALTETNDRIKKIYKFRNELAQLGREVGTEANLRQIYGRKR